MNPPTLPDNRPARGAVTASSAAAVAAGLSILERDGNAVDAAVAAALASCVADPCNTGLGGYGGHLVVAPPGQPARCVDFTLWAPGDTPDARLMRPYPAQGPTASCVPNVVAGLAQALTEFGHLDWAEVSRPAIALARDGVALNETTRLAFADAEGAPFLDQCFAFDRPLAAGPELFRQPTLAETLEQLAVQGPEWFYSGPLAELAETAWRSAGCRHAAAQWREAPEAVRVVPAARVVIDGIEFQSAPFATSGSSCALATLVAGSRLLDAGQPERPERLAEWAERVAGVWTHRFGQMHGNDFDRLPIEDWLDAALACLPGGALPDSPGHTCHLNTVDAGGTLVAVTLTHGPFWFGGRWALPDTGIVMNAGLHLFSAARPVRRAGRAYGVTNMAPTVVRTTDGSAIAIGCPGARRIPTTIGLALARHLCGGQSLQAAVSAGRFHAESRHQVALERDRLDPKLADALAVRFHKVEDQDPKGYYGPLTAIRRTADGGISFGLDDRAFRGYGSV